jgi:hypothetical protein
MFANGISTGALAVLLAGSQLAAAHMEISFPPPFRSKFNPHATNVDYTNTAPLAADGSNYPCKGYHQDMGSAAGASTASFAAGSQHNFTVVGGAPHGGGSCQVSLSYDKGKTFTVIQSIEGGCPLSSSYDFTIPADAPAGEAIWAWTWNNQIGNREFYMNCAPVTITGGSSKREVEEKRASAAFSSRPQVFVANLGNGCNVPEGIDVQYPNPGPDKVAIGSKLAPPTGNCGSAAGGGGSDSGSGSGSGSGSAPASSAVQATAAPATTAAPAASSAADLPGGVFITVPTGGASSSAPAAAPTTLVTSVASAPAASTVVSAPAATGTGSAGSGSGSSAGGHAAGTACSNEGAWNCINGTSFQRCASGVWSSPMAVAAGTTCKSGESETLSMDTSNSKLRLRSRFRGSAKLRLAA